VLPLASVLSGADGRFVFHSVNSVHRTYLSWFPPQEWLNGGVPLTGESAADLDLGEIPLRPASILRVAVELVGGLRLSREEREPAIMLQHKSRFGPRVGATRVGSEYVIRGVSFDEGNWEVVIYRKKHHYEKYTAPFRGRLGRRDQKFTLRLPRDKAAWDGSSLGGTMEVSESIAPPLMPKPEFTIAGKVAGPDGTPIEGALVSDFGYYLEEAPLRWVRTGPDGKFILKTHSDQAMPSISYGDSDYWDAWNSKPRLPTIDMPTPSRLAIRLSGIDTVKARASWWHDSLGWQHFSSWRPWIPAGGLGKALIRVTADGYLPLTSEIDRPYFDLKVKAPPTELPVEFRFDPSVSRTLSVFGAGRPLAGALVDVESVVNLQSGERHYLDTYVLPADGRLQLRGGANQQVEVFVHAEGFEPRRAIWNPDAPLAIHLTARNSRLLFAAASEAVIARVRTAGSPRAVRTFALNPEQVTPAHAAPGLYDITCHNQSGAVTGYQRVALAAASAASVDCSADRRPRLTVRLPGKAWHVSVSESTPRGAAAQWPTSIIVPNHGSFFEVAATVLRASETEHVLALSHAGRWIVEASEDHGAVRFWREIDIKPGASRTLALPKETGTLKASMRTYGGGLESTGHGFAGPRLQLLADNPTHWSVTDYLPERDSRHGDARHRFTLNGLPPGSYHLYHHLIGKPRSYQSGTDTITVTDPVDAWGGIPIRVNANSSTVLQDLSEHPLGNLKVQVIDAAGRPVEHATLRIRDRMSEMWRREVEEPVVAGGADDPIPHPAATRIVGGRAALPSIREGWLDLSVELDNGPAVSFLVPVSPQRELRLRLPSH